MKVAENMQSVATKPNQKDDAKIIAVGNSHTDQADFVDVFFGQK